MNRLSMDISPSPSHPPKALSRLPLLRRVTLGSLDVAPDSDYEELMAALVIPERRRTSCTAACTAAPEPSAAAFGGLGARDGDWEAEDSSPDRSKGGRGVREGAGARGGGTWHPGRLGAVSGMGSWRVLALCGEQRAEALVAAGPLPRGLREVRVEQLRWPRWAVAVAVVVGCWCWCCGRVVCHGYDVVAGIYMPSTTGMLHCTVHRWRILVLQGPTATASYTLGPTAKGQSAP